MMSTIEEVLKDGATEFLIRLSEGIQSNLENGCKGPSKEDLVILLNLLAAEIKRQQNGVEDLSSPPEAQFNELLMTLCKVFLHLLSHVDEQGGLDFTLVCKCVAACINHSEDCRVLVLKFFSRNLCSYINNFENGNARFALACETERQSYHFCPNEVEVPVSLMLQSLLVLSRDCIQRGPDEGQFEKKSGMVEDEIFGLLLRIICGGADDAVLAVTSQVIKVHLTSEDNKKALWERIILLSSQASEKTVAFGMACLMIDEFFCGTKNDIRVNYTSRDFIQNGLISHDVLTRKRAMYILKRIVDAPWEFDLQDESQLIWSQLDEFILIFETLEEKQLHVMLPILPGIAKVIQLSKHAEQGKHSLHVSWLTTILTRALNHENKFITKWAVETSLHLEVGDLQFFETENWFYICGPLFSSFKEFYLFEKESNTEESQSPQIVGLLREFFYRCQVSSTKANKEIKFFRKVIQSLCSSGLNYLTFPYVADSLSCIEIAGVIDSDILSTIKVWMLSETSTFPGELKAATYNILITIVSNCLSNDELTLVDLIKFLKVIFESRYLNYGGKMWLKISDKITKGIFSWKFEIGSEFEIGSAENLSRICQDVTGDFLRGHCTVFESIDEVVLFMFLSMSVICEVTNLDVCEQVGIILNPLSKVLVKVNRNPYLSSDEIARSVNLADFIIIACLRSIKECQGTLNPHIRILLAKLLEATRPCFSMFVNTFQAILTDENFDSVVITSFLKLNQSICEYLNVIGDGEDFSLIHHLTSLCKFNCQKLQDLTGLKNFKAVNIAFQMMKMLCDFVRDKYLENRIETKILLEKSLLNAIRGISLRFETYLPVGYFSDSSRKKSDVNNASLEVGNFTSALWSLVSFALQNPEIRTAIASNSMMDATEIKCSNVTLAACFIEHLVNIIIDTIDISVGDDIIPLLHCLEILMPDIITSSTALAVVVLEATWRLVMEQGRRDNTFWKIYKPSINILFHTSLLLSDDKMLLEKLRNYWCILEDLGQTKFGLFNAVVEHCCSVWESSLVGENSHLINAREHRSHESLLPFLDVIVDACVFGHVQKKVTRILQQEISYFTAKFESRIPFSNNINIDYKVRWAVVKMLLQTHRQNSSFITDVIEALIEKDRELSALSKRYYDNSLTHRQKLRIWQTMLVLHQFINKENASVIIDKALSVMISENQPSIRYYIEWFIIRTVSAFPALRRIIWDKLNEASERRVCSVTCLMSIITHLTVILPDDEFSEMAAEAFSKLLPWVQIHHMQARVHAQIVIWKLWDEAKQRRSAQVLHDFKIIESLFSLNETNASVFKARKELRNHFYFKNFHPIKHYSLETIFCSMPKLLKVGDDEIVSTSQLEELVDGKEELFGVKVYDKDPSLMEEVKWLEKAESSDNSAFPTAQKETGKEIVSSLDVQKKITAWKPLPPTEDPFLQKSDMYKKEMKRSQLILCASLIDRTPNLGGLCRTCEIFGVSSLVIGAMRYLDDPNFKSLSVTAEKWIDVEQVLPRHLAVYLRDMKNKGYRLVGIEQTANSKSLQEYEFQDKTLLLLGNEREGIPVNLIQLLDDCVEIPQQGVIRSLNVHVSGAIIIWEYCRQKLVTKL